MRIVLSLALLSAACLAQQATASTPVDFHSDPTFIVTTRDRGTLPADQGTMPVPPAAEPVVEAFKRELTQACREVGGTMAFKPDFATAVDVNADGRADVFVTAARASCDAAASLFSGSAGSMARWALSKADGTYRTVDMLHHKVAIEEVAPNAFQLVSSLHGLACGKGGAEACRHIVTVDALGEIHTVSWPDGQAKAEPAPVARQAAPRAAKASVSVATAGDASTWTHNGSTMLISEKLGQIVYEDPKPAIAGTVTRGTVLFEGRFSGRRISGIAYVFKRGCEPAGYPVSGVMEDNPHGFGGRIVLTGPAPRRDRSSCAIIGTTGAHSRLVFEEYGDI